MGMKAAAIALMCTDITNREALEITGFECPQSARDKAMNQQAAASAQPGSQVDTDPYIRARLGLPALQAKN